MPGMVNRELAKTQRLSVVMQFTGAGGGAWSYQVGDGACRVQEGSTPGADLVITQSPETFIKTFAKMHNPMIALLTRKMRVKGMRKVGTFGKLFAEPAPDTPIEPGAMLQGMG
jgi:putative sterol carrier protein